jgi:hypothetical protein
MASPLSSLFRSFETFAEFSDVEALPLSPVST